MSVFVKEMKMPETCKECPIFDEWNACGVTGSWDFIDVFDPSKERLKDCPLVEVPTPHGRLIDADALRQSIKENIDECHKWANEVDTEEMYARVSQSLGTFVECALRIKAAPTIIEAED